MPLLVPGQWMERVVFATLVGRSSHVLSSPPTDKERASREKEVGRAVRGLGKEERAVLLSWGVGPQFLNLFSAEEQAIFDRGDERAARSMMRLLMNSTIGFPPRPWATSAEAQRLDARSFEHQTSSRGGDNDLPGGG